MNLVIKALTAKTVDKLVKEGADVVTDFEKNRSKRAFTMKQALASKFQFLKSNFLSAEKGKFAVSSKTRADDFLRRMIVENPEAIIHSYADIFGRFNSGTKKEEFVRFGSELEAMKSNVVRVISVVKGDEESRDYIEPMEKFHRHLEFMIATASVFARMSDEDRKKVLSGDKSGLNDSQKGAVDARRKVEVLKSTVYSKSQKKEDKMKDNDRRIAELLNKLHVADVAEEMKQDVKKGSAKVFDKGSKIADKQRGKGGRVKVGEESIEKLDDAA